MVPKHPEVVTKGVRQLTFNQMSTVMELHFLKKKFPQVVLKTLSPKARVSGKKARR
jgi:hypothetical protein